MPNPIQWSRLGYPTYFFIRDPTRVLTYSILGYAYQISITTQQQCCISWPFLLIINAPRISFEGTKTEAIKSRWTPWNRDKWLFPLRKYLNVLLRVTTRVVNYSLVCLCWVYFYYHCISVYDFLHTMQYINDSGIFKLQVTNNLTNFIAVAWLCEITPCRCNVLAVNLVWIYGMPELGGSLRTTKL